MTKTEYESLYKQARSKAAELDIAERANIAKVYREAASQAADVVKETLERGLSSLTAERWRLLSSKLESAASSIATATEDVAEEVIRNSVELFSSIDKQYVLFVTDGIDKISKPKIDMLFSSVANKAVESLTTRLWADGYTFSQRIWGPTGVRKNWLKDMKMTIASGIAQGRDPVKIAIDIQVYTADGKVSLLNRWGTLKRGTKKFAKRIPKSVDWRAVRLVRSELSASIQDASIRNGELNPGCIGEYNWVLQPGRQHWGCVCPDYANGGPYTKESVPSYPHANCECRIIPILRNQREFVADLKRWANGDSVDYLDKWNNTIYKGAL